MDIVTHTLTGITLGSCLAVHTNSWKKRLSCLLIGGFGGMLPDLDVLSLWSRFDTTFGKWFSLPLPGKAIYSGKLWYSHHGFMHSLAAVLLFTLLIYLCFRLIHKQRRPGNLLSLSFAGGYILHLFQDMITPAGSWGGVRLFFPSTTYLGGTGSIWWWNNYDLFLTVLTIFVFNLILLLLKPLWKKKMPGAVWLLFTGGSFLFMWQVHTRNFNFNRNSYEACEKKSLGIQQQKLPGPVYRQMVKFDQRLPVYF